MTEKKQELLAGRYELVSQIGAGAFSCVYKANDRTLQKVVAVKVLLNSEKLTADQVRRFQQEAKIAAKLQHSNLIKILDCGITKDNSLFIVMDYVVGVSLSDYIGANGPLPLKKALPVFAQICAGMQQAHAQGILHRDLKSSNIMLIDPDADIPRVIVLDFGLAKFVKDGHATVTQPGLSIGTPCYMSPEHARGTALDRRSDVYSLGCIMYEALRGTPPFHCDLVIVTIMKQVNEPAPGLNEGLDGEIQPIFPLELERIIAKTLDKDPDKRFQSMDEVLSSLNAFVEGEKTLLEADLNSHETSLKASTPLPKVPLLTIRAAVVLACLACIMAVPLCYPLFREGETAPRRLKGDNDIPLMGDWMEWKWHEGLTWHKKFGVGDYGIKRELNQIAKFQYVSFWSEEISARGLSYLEHLPLKGLYLGESSIDDKALIIVGRIKTLEVLDINRLPRLHESALSNLKGLQKLKILNIEHDQFGDEALHYIGNLQSLQILDAAHNRINGEGLVYLRTLQNLRKLDLGETDLLGGNLVHLSGLTSLNELYLRRTYIDDASLSYLLKLPLVVIDVSSTKVSESGLEKLEQIKTLRRVYVGKPDSWLGAAVKKHRKVYKFEVILDDYNQDRQG